MSDKNQDKPDDFDVIFDSPSDENQTEAPAFGDVEAEYTDIDDGDEGIFAPETPAKKGNKSSGLLGAVALLAVVGAGGYVYYSNPGMIDQVKQNLLGAESSDVVAQDTETQPVEPQSPAPEEIVAEPAPDAAPELSQELASAAVADSVPVPSTDGAVQDSVAGADVSPPAEIVANEPVPPTEDVGEPVAKTEAPEQIMPEEPKREVVSEPVSTAPAESMVEATPPVQDAVKVEAPVLNDVSQPAPVSVPAPAPAPVVAKKVVEEKPVILDSPETQKTLADAKLDKYFDSPGGKILKDIPAPSMNPNKGKNESIIVVGKQPKKSHGYGQTGRVSIQTTDNDSQVVAASRAVLLQRYDAAKEMYDELYKLNPRDGRVLMGRAVVFQKMGQTEQAISAYEEVLQYHPDNAEAVVNLAGLIRKEYPAVALNKLLDLRQQYPDNAVVAAQLGVTYADAKNYQDAFRYLSMAASMEPENPQHFYNMAVVAEKAGDPQKAIQNYEKALEADAISGAAGKKISRERIYDRLTRLRGN